MKSQKGFSILELMTTIGILSLIGAVGFPAIDNFGDQENYENDLATIRGQVNIVRQLALEDGNAYTIRIVNDSDANTAEMQVWQAQGLNRYNVEYHQQDSQKCKEFGDEDDSSDDKGIQLTDYNKKLEHITISRCTTSTGSCSKVTPAQNTWDGDNVDDETSDEKIARLGSRPPDNFFCFLPDGSAPELSLIHI